MTPLIFQIALSNAFIALILAFFAMTIDAVTKRPQLAHLLWLLVFVKLVTPPVVTLPVIFDTEHQEPAAHSIFIDEPAGGIAASGTILDQSHSTPTLLTGAADVLRQAKPLMAPIWLLGSGVIFLGSLTRIYQFNRLLKTESEVAPETLQTSARSIVHRLGLKTAPVIYTTAARLSPMVWWIGGKVRVIVPLSLTLQMNSKETEWVLAHELAHVRRRDYLVRWIEWLSCVCFWWNPLVWWARHRLRINEEICCDDMVLARFNPTPHTYAAALLNAIEFLASPVIRPPAMASEINSGGVLERRFKMITSNTANRRITRWPQICVLLLAMAILPVGLTFAGNREGGEKKEACEKEEPASKKKSTDEDYRKTWEKLQAKVKAGEMTHEEARTKMMAIKKKAQAKNKQTGEKKEVGTKKETKSDEYYRNIWKKLQAKVEAGEMTQKEARTKMAAIKKKNDGPKTITREEYAKAEKKIRNAVESGKLTPEEGRKKLQWMREQMKEQAERERGVRLRPISREEYARAEAHMKKMVEAGEITEKDMNRRLHEMRRMMAGEHNRDKKEQGPHKITPADYDRAEARLFKAVENGRISAEDARKRLAEMRRMMAEQEKRDHGGKERDR